MHPEEHFSLKTDDLLKEVYKLGAESRTLENVPIALSFVKNPNNYSEINHKDENKENNAADNLEWCEHKENINYGTCKQRISKSKINNPVSNRAGHSSG